MSGDFFLFFLKKDLYKLLSTHTEILLVVSSVSKRHGIIQDVEGAFPENASGNAEKSLSNTGFAFGFLIISRNAIAALTCDCGF